MRISDWSSDVCSSDLLRAPRAMPHRRAVWRSQTGRGERHPVRAAAAAAQEPIRHLPPKQQTSADNNLRRAAPLGYTRPLDCFLLSVGTEGIHGRRRTAGRSEEHTSELQSLMRISYAVFCLTKKK